MCADSFGTRKIFFVPEHVAHGHSKRQLNTQFSSCLRQFTIKVLYGSL